MMSHRLRVAEVITETPDAVSLVFESPPGQRVRFAYRPGQFLTLRLPVPSGPVARCYSLASSPHVDRDLKVTVKRVAGGIASNWICDNAVPGSEIEVLEPAGGFTPDSLDEDLLLVAAGSGITPVMSILKSVLGAGSGTVVLCYANRTARDVIFADELREMARTHPDRLTVRHWLEAGRRRPTVAGLREMIAPARFDESFVCAPKPFMDIVRRALRDLDVPRSRVRVERFGSLDE